MSNTTTQTIRQSIIVPRSPAVPDRIRHVIGKFARTFAGWRRGAGDPLRLYYLNDHLLRDIGISRDELGRGPAESFWRD